MFPMGLKGRQRSCRVIEGQIIGNKFKVFK